MGFFKKLLNIFGLGKVALNILIIGLDNSGKTTIISKLKAKKSNVETVPTIGYSVESFNKKNFKFKVIDMSGQSKYRSMWETYYTTTNAVIYVVDSSDKIRFSVAKYELDQVLGHKDVKENKAIPILFFANKMDLDASVKPWELEEELELSTISDRSWAIFQSNAKTGDGLEEGLSWLMQKFA